MTLRDKQIYFLGARGDGQHPGTRDRKPWTKECSRSCMASKHFSNNEVHHSCSASPCLYLTRIIIFSCFMSSVFIGIQKYALPNKIKFVIFSAQLKFTRNATKQENKTQNEET